MLRNWILVALILATLALTIGSWAVLCYPSYSPTQSNNAVEHTNSNWTFPSNTGQSTPLPDFRPVVSKVMPSVVSVITETVVTDFFGRQYTDTAAGSGIIIDSQGYIATNNHVVEDARKIHVELIDGRIFTASVVGTDPLSDLAVIRVSAQDLPYADWGDSELLSVGEWVLAVGNALGEGISATEGIVSRLNVSVSVDGNTLYGLVQTTAAINPGNSGGPLVNMSGQVIGINSVKIVASEVEGIGYAISSNEAKPIIEHLIRYGHVTYPWLGVSVSTVTPLLAKSENLSVDRGAIIAQVVVGSPAHAAGLRSGDIIIRFAGRDIADVADLVHAIRASQIGQNVEIVFVRGNDTRTTSARLVERQTS